MDSTAAAGDVGAAGDAGDAAIVTLLVDAFQVSR